MSYSEEKALEYANKCLSCKNPSCESGCPIKNHIRDFIKKVKEKDYKAGAKIIYDNSILSFICSIVCPHEKHCEGHCILNKAGKEPVHIGYIEAFLTHKYEAEFKQEKNNFKKVLVVGSGPAGLYSALMLAQKGFQVDIYERTNHLGGVLSYGIPNFRLDSGNLKRIAKLISDYKINIIYNKYLTEADILKLKSEYDYLILACGLIKAKDARLGNSKRIIDATKLLEEYNYNKKYNMDNDLDLSGKAIVVGAGNVAMDVSRVLNKIGLDVEIVYRRTRNEAPATNKEIEEALNEGIIFNFLENPVEVIENDNNLKIKIEIMKLGEPDISGRRRPESTGEYIYKEANYLITAIGQEPGDLGFKVINTDYGYVVVNDNFETNIDNVYAIGDLTLGARTVVEACQSAKVAVLDILKKNSF